MLQKYTKAAIEKSLANDGCNNVENGVSNGDEEEKDFNGIFHMGAKCFLL
jgi:hypothetical protein